MTASTLADREIRVLAEMAALADAPHEYADVVQAVMDLLGEAVSSPFLGLSVGEPEQIAAYRRVEPDLEPSWEEGVARHVEETERHRLAGRLPATEYVGSYCLLAPPAWLVTVSAQSRSGRAAILTVASPESFTLSPEEEQILVRLSRQALLVLDHALLVRQVEGLEVMDALTGVATHPRLMDVLEYEIERHRYTGSTLTLMVVDVEGLASINRSYGNQYGDHLLIKLAGLIGDVVRPVDVVARYGLDEFAVVLPETEEEEGRELADDLRERVRSVTFAGDAVQISIGTTHARPSEALTAETLLRRAEQALHDAKRQDRDWDALWAPGTKKGMR